MDDERKTTSQQNTYTEFQYDIINAVWEACDSATLFGGFIRRMLEKPSTTYAGDIDFFIPCAKDVEDIIEHLETTFDTNVFKFEQYGSTLNNLVVYRVLVDDTRGNHRICMELDLVTTMDRDENPKIAFDLDVNTLHMTKDGDIGQRIGQHVNKGLKERAEDVKKTATIVCSIAKKQAKLICFSAKQYPLLRDKHSDDYEQYVRLLFRIRLPKILKNNWYVSNFNRQMACGHLFRFDLDFTIDESSINQRCVECDRTCIVFNDFTNTEDAIATFH